MKMRSNLLAPLLALFSLAGSCGGAWAQSGGREGDAMAVCAALPSAGTGRVFTVDPELGADTNDGSQEKPWRSLAGLVGSGSKNLDSSFFVKVPQSEDYSLVRRNPAGVIKPGDIIELRSGNYGHIVIFGVLNSEFVTVRSAAGHKPVISSLTIRGSKKWKFEGIAFIGNGGAEDRLHARPIVSIGGAGLPGPTEDIAFIRNRFSSAQDTSQWSGEDWIKRTARLGLEASGACMTIDGNHFSDLRNGVGLAGDRTILSNNVIERVSADAINFLASDLIIRGNKIRDNRFIPAEKLHPDAMQGWTIGGKTNKNIIIEGNEIIKTGDADQSTTHGITIFDGEWDGLRIINNVVVTNHWHGITLFGVNNANIVNNTVLSSAPTARQAGINVSPSKNGRPSKNIVVRNNFADVIVAKGESVEMDHNVARHQFLSPRGHWTKPGLYDGANRLEQGASRWFVEVDHRAARYDLRPRSTSPLVGGGSHIGAPDHDIRDVRREKQFDIGAYSAR